MISQTLEIHRLGFAPLVGIKSLIGEPVENVLGLGEHAFPLSFAPKLFKQPFRECVLISLRKLRGLFEGFL